jgi:hypothetical protein
VTNTSSAVAVSIDGIKFQALTFCVSLSKGSDRNFSDVLEFREKADPIKPESLRITRDEKFGTHLGVFLPNNPQFSITVIIEENSIHQVKGNSLIEVCLGRCFICQFSRID